jgi:hypothetical protein
MNAGDRPAIVARSLWRRRFAYTAANRIIAAARAANDVTNPIKARVNDGSAAGA